jgi:hypothetical protein
MFRRGLLPVIVLGLAACSSDSGGSASSASSANKSNTAVSVIFEPAATNASTTSTPDPTTTTERSDPATTTSSDDETASVWSSHAGITDAFIVLSDVPAPHMSPEGDVSAVSMEAPSGTAFVVNIELAETTGGLAQQLDVPRCSSQGASWNGVRPDS